MKEKRAPGIGEDGRPGTVLLGEGRYPFFCVGEGRAKQRKKSFVLTEGANLGRPMTTLLKTPSS